MKYFLIRHGKTDANRITRAAYDRQGAPLNEEGIQQAATLRQELIQRGVLLSDEPAAVSELLRTRQTAEAAGFKAIVTNSLLNEVNAPDPQKTTEDLGKGLLTPEAIAAAKKLLAHPPKEKIWITHGQLIAAVLIEIKQLNTDKLLPDFCEIREIEL